MHLVYIGLGSNLGDREANLRRAVDSIKDTGNTELLAVSSVLETAAVDFTEQPDFLNQIVKVRTGLGAFELLNRLKAIEEHLGRVHRFPKGPREIDLDILLFDDMVISDGGLQVPHPEILNRPFIVKHLSELDSDLRDPVSKEKYSDLLHNI